MPSSTGHQVRERLRQDHERLEGLLEEVLMAFDAGGPESVANALKCFGAELLAHLEAEEQFLIPMLFHTNPREGRALLEEHRHIRTRLTELGTDIDLRIVRTRAARAFVEELRAHARHEDSVLYRWADENVDDPDRQLLIRFLVGAAPARAVEDVR